MHIDFFKKRQFKILCGIFFLLLFVYLVYALTIKPPKNFPTYSIINISEGTGLLRLSDNLKQENIIRSPFWFRISAIILGGERGMQAGDYYMPSRENAFVVAFRIVRGNHRLDTVKVTIPEGFDTKKISALFNERFIYFDNSAFEHAAPEGYMFPDTYFIQVNATASSTIKTLHDNFVRKIFPIMPEIEASGHSLEEVVTLASILENEAKTKEDREIVSGILWKRIRLGMPLQVDATFAYINGKTTKELTADDLKINSPYNTYIYKGLPPTPISNPGIESIESALHPTTTPYLYFLTGDDGKMYYAKTFDEHVRNKTKYIKQ